MADLHDLSALEQAAALRLGELSSAELTEHYLRRIEALSAQVGAYVTVTAERARAEAGRADMAGPAGGRDPVRGVLHGVPVPVKDLTMVAGVRTTFGSAAFADFVPDADDHVVTLLRAGGTVLLGKTNTPELGLPCYTEPDVAPPARSPWDLTRTAGGSSGGAAAAVAAGLAPVALGNDGGGSVRIPAAACGLVGLKTSRGRISAAPAGGDVLGLVCHGPLARTVADAAALLDVLAGPAPGDPHWAPPPGPGQRFADAATAEPPRRRIARFAAGFLTDAPLHPDCRRAWEEASSLLAGLGHEVVDVDPPGGGGTAATFLDVWAALAAAAPIPAAAEGRLRPLTRWLREHGRGVDAPRFLTATAELRALARRTVAVWEPFDAVLTPTLAAPPPPIGALRDDADPAADFAAQMDFTPYTSLANLTGQPSITLPLHHSTAGLPIGVMLTGRPAGDAELLALAGQVERAAPWRERRPPCWRA